MFGLGSTEIIVVLILLLIVIGPKQMPQVAKTIVAFLNDCKRFVATIQKELPSTHEMTNSLEKSISSVEKKDPPDSKKKPFSHG